VAAGAERAGSCGGRLSSLAAAPPRAKERRKRAHGGAYKAWGRVLTRVASSSDVLFSLMFSLSYVLTYREINDTHSPF
jgi:hypothetical protein